MEHLYAAKSFITLAIGRMWLTVTKDGASLLHSASNECNKMFYCTEIEVPFSKDFFTSGGCFLRISHGAPENKNKFFFNPINRGLAIEKLFFLPLPFNICCGKWHAVTGVFPFLQWSVVARSKSVSFSTTFLKSSVILQFINSSSHLNHLGF